MHISSMMHFNNNLIISLFTWMHNISSIFKAVSFLYYNENLYACKHMFRNQKCVWLMFAGPILTSKFLSQSARMYNNHVSTLIHWSSLKCQNSTKHVYGLPKEIYFYICHLLLLGEICLHGMLQRGCSCSFSMFLFVEMFWYFAMNL